MNILKWSSTLILSIGLCMTAANIYPLNLYVQLVGALGWFTVGLMWKDYSIMFINAVGSIILFSGVIYSL